MNKIIVSIILAVVLMVGINKITDVIFYVEKPEKSSYQVASVTTTASTSTSSASSEGISEDNIMALFASTSASEGAKVFKKCAACHSIKEGGANKIGPALWGVLGRTAGSISDYKYSKAMAAYGKPWSFEEMNGFLIKPKDWIKGTKMSFAGLKNANSTEFDKKTKYPVIDLMESQKAVKIKGGTMRLGAYDCEIKTGTRAYAAYRKKKVSERHRHRYEVNNRYRNRLEKSGLIFSGINSDLGVVETIEIKGHPWFVAGQFHPELKSRVSRAHPLFREFIKASVKYTP